MFAGFSEQDAQGSEPGTADPYLPPSANTSLPVDRAAASPLAIASIGIGVAGFAALCAAFGYFVYVNNSHGPRLLDTKLAMKLILATSALCSLAGLALGFAAFRKQARSNAMLGIVISGVLAAFYAYVVFE
jgi:hypothetical protein